MKPRSCCHLSTGFHYVFTDTSHTQTTVMFSSARGFSLYLKIMLQSCHVNKKNNAFGYLNEIYKLVFFCHFLLADANVQTPSAKSILDRQGLSTCGSWSRNSKHILNHRRKRESVHLIVSTIFFIMPEGYNPEIDAWSHCYMNINAYTQLLITAWPIKIA